MRRAHVRRSRVSHCLALWPRERCRYRTPMADVVSVIALGIFAVIVVVVFLDRE
jgi:hypothetical protein